MSMVVCTVDVGAGLDAAWGTLTRRSEVGRWWGMPDQDIRRVAQALTVHTGPHSFYRLWIEEFLPPLHLRFTASFLGVSPTSTVDCDLVGTDDGWVQIRVREELPAEDGASIGLADDLWRKRLSGLRSRLEGVIPDDESPNVVERCALPALSWRPLHPENLPVWLPISGPGVPSRRIYVVDTEGARPFPVTGWWVRFDERLVLDIAVEPTSPPTRAEITVSADDEQLTLAVVHRGWNALALDEEISSMVRSRFGAMWRCALDRAARAQDGRHR